MKLYQVIFEDEYNNLYLIGFYKKLSDSVPEINKYLSDDFDKLNDGDLVEYVSTFGTCFDRCIANKDDSNCVYVRGFVVDSETLLKEIDYDRN